MLSGSHADAQPIRVLDGPGTGVVAGAELARAEQEFHVKSWTVALYGSPHWNEVDEDLTKYESIYAHELKRWQLLWRALRHFDVIHFNLGLSIMPWRSYLVFQDGTDKASRLRLLYRRTLELSDLPLLKWARKGIVVTYQGDDVRQGDFCAKSFCVNATSEAPPGHYSAVSDASKRERVARFGKYAHIIYALNPDLLYVLPSQARFLPYSHVDPRSWVPVPNSSTCSRPPVVLHAPSNRNLKGTRFVLDAVARLQGEGIPMEFLLVEGLPNSEARKLYAKADLLIDQLLLGWYGGLAVELMALGKPVMCYIRQEDLKFIPEDMRRDLPIINVTPSNIYDALKEWLTVRKVDLPEEGAKGRAYVEKWHDPVKIATRTKQDYEHILADIRKER